MSVFTTLSTLLPAHKYGTPSGVVIKRTKCRGYVPDRIFLQSVYIVIKTVYGAYHYILSTTFLIISIYTKDSHFDCLGGLQLCVPNF